MDDLNSFRKGLQFVLKWEGGYVNDPDDPGGETKWGISKRYHPNEDIKNLTPERAAEIYQEEYWDRAGCDNVPFPDNVAIFDTAVNCGVSRAVKWAREMGMVEDLINARQQFYFERVNKNPPSIKYLRGWLARLSDLEKFIEINTPSNNP